MSKPKKAKKTEQEKTLEIISIKKHESYVKLFRPAEKKFIEQIQVTQGEREQIRGRVAADSAAANKDTQKLTRAAQRARGGEAGSGASILAQADASRSTGSTRGLGVAAADVGAVDAGLTGQVKAVAFGENIAHDALINVSQGAERATRQIIADVANKNAIRENLFGAAGTIAGAGFEATRNKKKEAKLRKTLADAGVSQKDIEAQVSIAGLRRGSI